ncbi:MAG: Txe/YoeB family addiction module toxin [Phascolarctobacterium sp.]|nr:Txe/YoeB family addiction module toxin [Phascolarctobacterium sp.]
MRKNAFGGTGKPEQLRGQFSGFCSRRIDNENRIVYYEQDGTIYIISCKGHYDD